MSSKKKVPADIRQDVMRIEMNMRFMADQHQSIFKAPLATSTESYRKMKRKLVATLAKIGAKANVSPQGEKELLGSYIVRLMNSNMLKGTKESGAVLSAVSRFYQTNTMRLGAFFTRRSRQRQKLTH